MGIWGVLLLGLLLVGLGLVNRTGNISTIHWYNRRRVREEDIPAYGKAVGNGTIVIGVAVAVSPLLMMVSEVAAEAVIVAGVVAGLGFILYGQFRYNGGIF